VHAGKSKQGAINPDEREIAGDFLSALRQICSEKSASDRNKMR